MIKEYEKVTLNNIIQLSEDVKEQWINVPIEKFFDNCTDDMGDFGLKVYSYLKDRGYARDNLTTKNCIKPDSDTLKKIIQAMLKVREDYNEELTDDNIDEDTEDYSDYEFGEIVLTIIYGKKDGYDYRHYPFLD